MVETLSKCDAQDRLGFARAIREKYRFPEDWSLQHLKQGGVHISLDTTVPEFEAYVSGLHDFLRHRFGRREQIPEA